MPAAPLSAIDVRLSAGEYEVLRELARLQELPEIAVLRQALCLYRTVHAHAMRGERQAFVDASGAVVASRPMTALVD